MIFWLALLQIMAWGVDRSDTQCKKKALDACHSRAEILLERTHDPAALPAAVKMLEKACKWKHGPACESRGLVALEGLFGEVDAPASVPWFDAGCDLDVGSACNRAAVQRYDDGPSQDIEHADRLARKACDLGSAWGCMNLGDQRIVEDDPEGAKVWLAKACDAGLAQGCNLLGVAYYRASQDAELGLPFFHRACDMDFGQACTNIHALTFTEDPRNAWNYAMRGCELDFEEGCSAIAYKGPLDGVWRVTEVWSGGEARGEGESYGAWFERTQTAWEWGAMELHFDQSTLTVIQWAGVQLDENLWVPSLQTKVGVVRTGSVLQLDQAPVAWGALEMGEVKVVFSMELDPKMRLFQYPGLPARSCRFSSSGEVCRLSMVAWINGTAFVVEPNIESLNVEDELPW